MRVSTVVANTSFGSSHIRIFWATSSGLMPPPTARVSAADASGPSRCPDAVTDVLMLLSPAGVFALPALSRWEGCAGLARALPQRRAPSRPSPKPLMATPRRRPTPANPVPNTLLECTTHESSLPLVLARESPASQSIKLTSREMCSIISAGHSAVDWRRYVVSFTQCRVDDDTVDTRRIMEYMTVGSLVGSVFFSPAREPPPEVSSCISDFASRDIGTYVCIHSLGSCIAAIAVGAVRLHGAGRWATDGHRRKSSHDPLRRGARRRLFAVSIPSCPSPRR